jgi:hypothetical protein
MAVDLPLVPERLSGDRSAVVFRDMVNLNALTGWLDGSIGRNARARGGFAPLAAARSLFPTPSAFE